MKDTGAKGQNLLTKGSLNHLKHQLKKTPEQHFAEIKKVIELAEKESIKTNVYLEDWSNGMRNSQEYVYQFLDFLETQSIERVLLPDTLGVLSPEESFKFLSEIRSKYPKLHIDFHAHNDYDLGVSNALAGNFWWFLPLLFIVVTVLVIWLRTASGKLILHKFLLRLPLVGQLIKQMTTAQLARSLSTLISGGITVPDSWDITSQAINNLELRRRSQSVLPMIREGRSFSEALENANWLPDLGLDMIGIGESSGSLREMLDEVANFYDAESEVRLEQLTTLLEPLILVFMAIIVVMILLAIYLPIIQAISSGPFGGR